jgi:hypothetical protein
LLKLPKEAKKNKQLGEKNYDALKKELVDFSSQYSGLVYQHITLLEKTSKQYERIVNDNLKKEKAKENKKMKNLS